jgi:hypothetical protein
LQPILDGPALLPVLHGRRLAIGHQHPDDTLEHMSIDDIIDYVVSLGGVLTLRPGPGDGSPEISWGDVFFYYAPDGQVPKSQPFATIVTKDYPGDEGSRLDRADTFRLNVHVGTTRFREILHRDPHEPDTEPLDPSTPDVLVAHPVYGHLAWLAVVNPGERTSNQVRDLLQSAHRAARARYQRRSDEAPPSGSRSD